MPSLPSPRLSAEHREGTTATGVRKGLAWPPGTLLPHSPWGGMPVPHGGGTQASPPRWGLAGRWVCVVRAVPWCCLRVGPAAPGPVV